MSTQQLIILPLNFGKSSKGKFLWKRSTASRVEIKQFWKLYYSFRNTIYLAKLYQESKARFYLDLLKLLIKCIGGYILYDDFKIERVRLILRALNDGIKSKMGKTVDLGE